MITNINEFKKTLIVEKESPNPDYKTVDPKDKKRIADILSKSDKSGKKKFGNFTAVKNDKAKIKEEEEAKAKQMAKSITTYTKALRRGNAAKEIGKDNIAEIFYKRAKELKPKNESAINESAPSMKYLNNFEVYSLVNEIVKKYNLPEDDVFEIMKEKFGKIQTTNCPPGAMM